MEECVLRKWDVPYRRWFLGAAGRIKSRTDSMGLCVPAVLTPTSVRALSLSQELGSKGGRGEQPFRSMISSLLRANEQKNLSKPVKQSDFPQPPFRVTLLENRAKSKQMFLERRKSLEIKRKTKVIP